MKKTIKSLASLFFILPCTDLVAEESKWPNNAKAAVSLSYDDALSSQVENAIPALNKYGLKGSFYVTLSAPGFRKHVEQWQQAAKDGHELANHTVYHGCNGEEHDWVRPEDDLSKRTAKELVREVETASVMLNILDGKTERTFTAPCVDPMAGDENYVEQLKGQFAGMKASYSVYPIPYNQININDVPIWAPVEVSGKRLIQYVEAAAKVNGLASITFHGIGGDHLAVSNKAHEELLAYLVENKETYWVDTFLNISKHVEKTKANSK
ncbi:polysaccharide deacetylase family protein [Catenovulum sp. SM1970]|uniref:polysaccharide deacetylase family protein n=1 Tax=Marinifaba aquimaris TaxID=2741323 RepID=UPI0015746EAF|nr:polysaccharide deacetylase family protein [Marinifaba aquimaris]NTS77053.1 polysaccharide deacetylase family protein [Marinifaba aquimaris]